MGTCTIAMRAARPHSAPRRRPTNLSTNGGLNNKSVRPQGETIAERGGQGGAERPGQRIRPVSAPRQRHEVVALTPEWHHHPRERLVHAEEGAPALEPWECSTGSLASWRHSMELPDDFMAVENWHLMEHEASAPSEQPCDSHSGAYPPRDCGRCEQTDSADATTKGAQGSDGGTSTRSHSTENSNTNASESSDGTGHNERRPYQRPWSAHTTVGARGNLRRDRPISAASARSEPTRPTTRKVREKARGVEEKASGQARRKQREAGWNERFGVTAQHQDAHCYDAKAHSALPATRGCRTIHVTKEKSSPD